MLKIKIGGVPEHFNYPWYLTLKNKEYAPYGINLRWKDFHGGTGEMTTALRERTLDIAVVLTEGIIKDIQEGNPSRIVQTYIDSPLIWGVHVAKTSGFYDINELEHATAAISRYGSGSHLMAIVHAYNMGWDINKLHFCVVKNLEGGIAALQAGKADYFMWEYFTTKPLVDGGIFRRLGNCPTPWPCFVIAVREEVLIRYPKEIKYILNTINKKTKNFKDIPGIDTILSARYKQRLEDIQQWLSMTKWNSGNQLTPELILEIQNKMEYFNVIQNKMNAQHLIKNMYI